MRLLIPPLLVAGMCSFSAGPAFAQAPVTDSFLSDGEGEPAMRTLTATVTTVDALSQRGMSAPRAHAADVPALVAVPPGLARLRPMGSALATVVAQATARSATFRQLVHAIGQTDGIVYVENGRCGRGAHACLLAVTAAGGSRIVRVRVDARGADWELMGLIGHELQHAVEVLSEPAITNTTAMLAFYLREGRRIGNLGTLVETVAAVRAGDDVRTEARRAHLSRQTP